MKPRQQRLVGGVIWLCLAVVGISQQSGPRLCADEPKGWTILQENRVAVSAVAFSPDGKTLASGSVDHTIKLWDMKSGKVLTTLNGHTDVVLPMLRTTRTASPDAHRFRSTFPPFFILPFYPYC